MEIIIATISILGITAFVWTANRILPFYICPICAGVSGTWIWIVIGMFFGLLDAGSWSLVAALAMGGSVVGIAYQMEKYLSERCSPLLWKTLFIPTGFVLVYSILSRWMVGFWVSAPLLAIWLLSCWGRSRRNSAEDNKQIEMLKKKMKNCC
ncbi:MAG: hypothetical protein Q7R73_05295 [bacterium]|nr:hypothetical protein [bacterium]